MIGKVNIKASLLIGISFFWTGSLFLSWMYHLVDIGISTFTIDLHTDAIGYLLQALGCFVVSIILKRKSIDNSVVFLEVNLLTLLFGFLAFISKGKYASILLGFAMNISMGILSGIYIYYLYAYVDFNHKALSFGLGYGLGTILTYFLVSLFEDNFLKNPYVFIVYLVSIIFAQLLNRWKTKIICNNPITYEPSFIRKIIIFILFINIIKNGSFNFPLQDITSDFSLELSRCFYAFGLLVAGIINDFNRKNGLLLCLISLMFPFVMLTLEQLIETKFVIWNLNYFFFGFFNIYRIVLFSDLAFYSNTPYLCEYGFVIGRLGDGLGSLLGLYFSNNPLLFIAVMIVIYLISLNLFFTIYKKLYPSNNVIVDEQIHKRLFISQYDFSLREKEVFNLIIADKNNKQIAEELYISTNTVKTHIKNILKKTGCSNKLDLIKLYHDKLQ